MSSPSSFIQRIHPLIAAVIFVGSANLNPAAAQCSTFDAYEPNNTCATAAPIHTHTTSDLSVSLTDSDHYSISLPPGATCNLDVLFEHSDANIDVRVYSGCGNLFLPFVSGLSTTDDESVSWTNQSVSTKEYFVRISTIDPSACGEYELHVEIPLCPLDDRFESTNDNCFVIGPPPPLLDPGTYNALASIVGDNDYYRVRVPNGATARVSAWFNHGGFNGNIDLEVRQTCGSPIIDTSLSSSDNEVLQWTNSTGATRIYYVRVFQDSTSPGASCAEYALTVDVLCVDDDAFEDFDTCDTALSTTPGTYQDRIARLGDEDWYSILVPNSATLRATLNFSHADADLDLHCRGGCPDPLITSSISLSDNEQIRWTNGTGEPVLIRLQVLVYDPIYVSGACASYDLTLAFEGGTIDNVVPGCLGDGSGTPCPCNNDSSLGHPGGCSHQDGLGAILFASGTPSSGVGGGPSFRVRSGPTNSFAILVSGDNALPQVGPCIGCGIAAFDGLRCVGGNFLRHGSRAIDSIGNSNADWGPPSNPQIGIAQASGFVDGQTRHFQAFVRTDLAQTCGTGQNATNSMSVTFGP